MKSSTDVTAINPGDAITSPASSQARHNATAAPHRSAFKRFLKPGLSVIAALALAWLGQVVLHTYRYEATDDAYIVGHLHQISPQNDGQVKEVLVNENQDVKAGDVLVRLDPLESEIAVQKARAGLEQARAQEAETFAIANQADAQLAEARARVTQSEAQIAQASAQLELARLTLSRGDGLFGKGGVISQAELDNARAAFKAAEAAHGSNQAALAAAQSAVGSAQAAQRSAQAQISAAHANVTVAETVLKDAERKSSYTEIKAPVAGRIGNKAVETGNRVLAGQILFSLAAPDMWIVANFKETQLARIRAGQPVEITIDALSGPTLHGVIDSIAPASGAQFALLPPNNATGNFNKIVQRVPVKITLDETSLRAVAPRLRLGLSVVAEVRVR